MARIDKKARQFGGLFLCMDLWGFAGSGDLGRRFNTLFVEIVAQFALFKHFANNIAAADKLAFDIKLRNGRPVLKNFNAFAQFIVFQHIDPFKRDADMRQNLHHLA